MNSSPDSPGLTPPPVPWLSTQHEMEAAALPVRTRLVKVRMRPGVHRVAQATCLHAAVDGAEGRREHLYRVTLEWLAEFDVQTGRGEKINDRASASRATNTLQLRVLEQARPDGRRVALCRLGPRGQIAADPKGHGIMSFLRGVLVEWAAAEHPDAAVVGGSFAAGQQGEADRALREQFFERSGFTVTADADGGVAFSAPALRELRTAWNREKVAELTPPMVAEAFCAQAQAGVFKRRAEALESQVEGLAKDRRAAEVMSRIWLAITVLAIVFGIVFGIQPRVA
ncbi:MAG: hypothetical protein ABW032_11650 [Burkholderiaceae bacterium]